MAKAPENPRDIFEEFTSDCKQAFGDDLVSIILYGSAAGRDYRPGHSDINFMIVLSDRGIDRLDQAFDLVKKWRKRKAAVPLFLTDQYVETSLDVFPIEYLDLKNKHILVHGKDILSDLSFEKEHVRLQCEREIKGKLLLLREAFLETEGKGRLLREVIDQSLPAFVAVFEALLFLQEQAIPEAKRDILRTGCETLDLDADVFGRLVDVREESIRLNDAETRSLYKAYLSEAKKLYRIVDQMGG